MLLRAGDLLVQRVPGLRWWALVQGSIEDIVVTEQGTVSTVLRHLAHDSGVLRPDLLDPRGDLLEVAVDGRECRIFFKPDQLEQLWEVTCIQ